ncbi:helix-turn-helix transcriptional regulator [Devosia sp. FJ2-5-3]|jgi:transcriptional regulator with XRE-family HTH domain|uniref:helix-turn-helix domain-containing protein n=1 Tax=Devosia sp. FJ2-5-3 TaxID=2976680 RepID=UPI0023D85FCC|nr:helix-turn-helix transcriptional regulator [Devosia sp. FJ2-5-3]WEJ59169.1 helix-turn-helix domain-containing protein [Devosia sp. FJ2-5-3]
MYTHPQFGQSTAEIQMLRQQAGRWLRALRERAGMSQRELAKAVGFEYYTFISQLEGGRGRLPPAQYLAFAEALDIPLHDFVKTLMRYYDPITYYALFEISSPTPSQPLPDVPSEAEQPKEDNVVELTARIARLEALLVGKK